MPVFQAIWMYCLDNPARALNALALFYALAGGWLCAATQLRASRASARLATNTHTEVAADDSEATRRVNRMFYSVGGACLGLAVLLSLVSTHF
ncbi:hypothetical protein SAMN05216421_0480 [Halopseudomonas xinjiangensis]|uniref:Uncharacterized protein n=1 Tax=Halopseudomonas xinjiangensis TaxID=487184 RepID=A0A1H1MJG9_9GAMM|nr:hypothetical protein [Halopseudomonas xinjiangensis]SDR86923.1 hypothetical protein SAMN05216421_0480 [Halopseudomonas xinjiangensis]